MTSFLTYAFIFASNEKSYFIPLKNSRWEPSYGPLSVRRKIGSLGVRDATIPLKIGMLVENGILGEVTSVINRGM